MTTREHRQYLESFWVQASTANSPDERLNLLRRLASLPVVAPHHRSGRSGLSLMVQPSCWACREQRITEWHHIIPVKCGGRTHRFNLVAICEPCHLEVHATAQGKWVPVIRQKRAPTPAPQAWELPARPPIRHDRPYGYPCVALNELDPARPSEHYEELADAYQLECAAEEERKFRAYAESRAWEERQREHEFSEGNFDSVEDEYERERLQEQWLEREAELAEEAKELKAEQQAEEERQRQIFESATWAVSPQTPDPIIPVGEVLFD